MKLPPRSAQSTRWLDLVKAIALLWVFLNHVVERIIDSPYISNPNSNWPPLSERVQQLAPLDFGSAASNLVMNFVRYLGWAGDQGVQLFLIASGFGLTWSLLNRGAHSSWNDFFRRRLWRIFPLWWGAHVMFLVLSIFVGGKGMDPFDSRFYLSLLGFRATPEMMYYFAPAWWYIGLTIQLYLVFPLLAYWLFRTKAARFLGAILGVSFLVRLVGLYAFDQYLDAWSRGAIFFTRLPEFAFGMALAWWAFKRPEATDRLLRRPVTLMVGVVVYAAATGLALTLWGMTVAPFLHGVAVFVWIYAFIQSTKGRFGRIKRGFIWIGAFSYSLYLTHHPVIAFFMDRQTHPVFANIAAGLPVFGVALILALILEWTVKNTQSLLAGSTRSGGLRRTFTRLMVLTTGLAALSLSLELSIRKLDPQEADGWGERPSLQAHDDFGWNLIPNQTTHLRWESYDYVLEANELGFPGPIFSESRKANTFRIMTLGDAFTSAEGVDTNESWPRLLENSLGNRLQEVKVEVLNFGVTGYGPNQYAAVFKNFAPRFRPDVVLIGFFVNEYLDVSISQEDFRESIGFDRRKQDSVTSYLEAAHLRRWLQLRFTQPLHEWLTGNPRYHGYFLGNFRALETDSSEAAATGRQLVRDRLAEMKSIAITIDAEIVLAQIPAPAQVCGPEDLAYYPLNVNLDDPNEYDIELPQRITSQICAELGIVAFDLRGPLQSLESCPYQSQNMHWLPVGHQVVADFLAESLTRNGLHLEAPIRGTNQE